MPIDFNPHSHPSAPLPTERFSSSREIIHELLQALATHQDASGITELFRHIRPGVQTARTAIIPGPNDPNGVLASGLIHPRLAGKLESLLDACRAQGLNVMLWEGYRGPARQDALFAQGGVTQARAGRSWHNYGLAADIVFTDENGHPSWATRHDWEKLGRIGKELGLTWGGNFKRIKDLGHFEWHPGMTISNARSIAGKSEWMAVWERMM